VIDLHCHILPGIDDGPKTLSESLEMSRIFEQSMYSYVVATPHAVPGTALMPEPEELRDRMNQLDQAMKKAGIKLKILPGMEIAFDPTIVSLLDHGKLQTLAGSSYVLIELPFQRLPLGWEHVIFDVQSKGYAVLLAHPERCAQLTVKPQLCDKLIESGVYFQVNWGSFLGHHGRATQKMASYLANKAYIHALASDSHNAIHLNLIQVQIASAKIEELIGARNLHIIARENPVRILGNEALRSMEKSVSKATITKGSKWRFWQQKESKIVAQS
jgi:protein-tyrosine phosphatase